MNRTLTAALMLGAMMLSTNALAGETRREGQQREDDPSALPLHRPDDSIPPTDNGGR